MTTSEIRRAFLDFFVGNDHRELPSASLIPHEDDATVLLTIAGMQPLKSYFLGTATPPAPRLTPPASARSAPTTSRTSARRPAT
jgi:alanyl-tRNA synthetase